MKIVFVLIILAVILLSVAIVIFFWAVKQRQFDDLDVHAYSILNEDVFDTEEDEDLKASIPLNPSKPLKPESITAVALKK